MDKSVPEQRMAENEAVFRNENQRVQRELKKIAKDAKKEGHGELFEGEESPLHFHCECANEQCHERIIITPSEYQKAHSTKLRFIVLHGHNVPAVERIVREAPNYMVVEKFITPPENATELKPTSLNP